MKICEREIKRLGLTYDYSNILNKLSIIAILTLE